MRALPVLLPIAEFAHTCVLAGVPFFQMGTKVKNWVHTKNFRVQNIQRVAELKWISHAFYDVVNVDRACYNFKKRSSEQEGKKDRHPRGQAMCDEHHGEKSL